MAVNGKNNAVSAPLLKNTAAAPVVYFDGVPVYGTFGGNIEIELATRVLLPKGDGMVAVDMTCAAHLRCSPQAAEGLIKALQHAVAMCNSNTMPAAAEPARLNS